MGVQLTKSGVTSVSLPFPAGNAQVKPLLAQTVHRTAGNTLYAVKHAPTKYQITRKFESLSDTEIAALVAFFNSAGGLAAAINYVYTPHGGSSRTVPCSIAEPPDMVRVSRDIWDVTVVFEQSVHPNRTSEPAT